MPGSDHTNAHTGTHTTEIIPFTLFRNTLSFTGLLPFNVFFYSYV